MIQMLTITINAVLARVNPAQASFPLPQRMFLLCKSNILE